MPAPGVEPTGPTREKAERLGTEAAGPADHRGRPAGKGERHHPRRAVAGLEGLSAETHDPGVHRREDPPWPSLAQHDRGLDPGGALEARAGRSGGGRRGPWANPGAPPRGVARAEVRPLRLHDVLPVLPLEGIGPRPLVRPAWKGGQGSISAILSRGSGASRSPAVTAGKVPSRLALRTRSDSASAARTCRSPTSYGRHDLAQSDTSAAILAKRSCSCIVRSPVTVTPSAEEARRARFPKRWRTSAMNRFLLSRSRTGMKTLATVNLRTCTAEMKRCASI